jgi:hypothetical protein
MYFNIEQIDAELTYLFYKQRFVDPRVLPCGNICCFDCIKRELNVENGYKCNLSDNIHDSGNQYSIPHLVKNLLKKTKRKFFYF